MEPSQVSTEIFNNVRLIKLSDELFNELFSALFNDFSNAGWPC